MKIRQKDKVTKQLALNTKMFEKVADGIRKLVYNKRERTIDMINIHIVYNSDADKNMAASMRKSLNSNGNIATMSNYETHKTTVSEIPDYYIFINHPEDELPDNMYKFLNKYGCEISTTGHYIHLKYDKNYCNGKNITAFVDYYKEVVNDAYKKQDEIRKIRGECLKAQRRASKKYDSLQLTENFCEFVNNFTYKLDEIPAWLAVPVGFLSLPIIAISGFSLLPIELTKIGVEMIADSLKDKNFEKNSFITAQQQILHIKVLEYFTKLQNTKFIDSKK